MADEFKSIAQIERQERMRNKKKSEVNNKEISELIKNTLIMLAIALVAGGVLGFVYEITQEPIAQMEERERNIANQSVFMLATSFSDSIIKDHPMTDEIKDRYPGFDVDDCIEAYDSDGKLLGYVLMVTSHEGYGGDISFSLGVCTDGLINGISITDISETAGLGMRASEVLAPQFKNRNELVFEVTKTGAINDNQIDAISSATITSKAVTNAVNGALEYFRICLMGGAGNES